MNRELKQLLDNQLESLGFRRIKTWNGIMWHRPKEKAKVSDQEADNDCITNN